MKVNIKNLKTKKKVTEIGVGETFCLNEDSTSVFMRIDLDPLVITLEKKYCMTAINLVSGSIHYFIKDLSHFVIPVKCELTAEV